MTTSLNYVLTLTQAQLRDLDQALARAQADLHTYLHGGAADEDYANRKDELAALESLTARWRDLRNELMEVAGL